MIASEGEVLRQGLAVVAVIALLGLFAWKLRRGAVAWPRTNGSPARLAATARVILTPQHSVHLVRVDDRELVVATHPQGCSLLSELTQERPA